MGLYEPPACTFLQGELWPDVSISLLLPYSNPCPFSTPNHTPLVLSPQASFAEIRRIELSAAIHEVIFPRAAVGGRFARGLPAGPPGAQGAEEIFLVVRGDAAVRKPPAALALTPSHVSASLHTPSSSAHGSGSGSGAVEKFKAVVFNCASGATTRKVGKMRLARQCATGLQLDGEDALVYASKAKIFVWLTRAGRAVSHAGSEGVITCVAGCSQQGLVVTGHEHGEMLLWHDLPRWVKECFRQAQPAAPVCTKLHWHAHPVLSLALSGAGDYVFSGGDEGTLVVWQVATGKTSFVPRLGAAITHISAAAHSAKVVAAVMDNSLHVVDAAKMRQDWCLRSLCVPQKAEWHDKHADEVASLLPTAGSQFVQSCAAFRCGIKIEPRLRHAVCNGYPGQLQSLDLASRTLRATLEVVTFTRVSRTEAQTRLYAPSVTHFEFLDCPLGLFLATLDVRRGAGDGPGLGGEKGESEASLKFFQWDAGRNEYRLTAQVDRPHGAFRVTSMAFAPPGGVGVGGEGACVVCATAAVDGTVKLWRAHAAPISALASAAAQGGRATAAPRPRALTWSCAFSFQHKDCPCHALAYSCDGSLLAVAQENVVTLWDPSR